MLRVELRQARPGMELAMPVTHPSSPDTVLLRAGYVLDEKTIARLSQFRTREVWISYPGMEFVGEHISPAIIGAGQRLAGAVAQTFDGPMTGGAANLDYEPFRRAIGDLMDRLAENRKAGLFVMDLASSQVPMSRSAGQVAYLSLVMGLKLDTYLILSRSRLGSHARDVSGLGMGALLRDVGLLGLDPEQRRASMEARDPDDPLWEAHVTEGYEMVSGSVEPSAASAVLHHHQHFDGTGFPGRTDLAGVERALSGTDIHVFARIIGAADLFDAKRYRVSDPDGSPTPTVRVLRDLVRGPESAWLDPLVVRALVHAAPPFAPGTQVTLSNGLRCVVAGWDPLDPCRPRVAVLDRHALEPGRFSEPRERIDLSQHEDLSIVEAEGQDVSGDLFFPESRAEFDVHAAQTALIRQPADSSAA